MSKPFRPNILYKGQPWVDDPVYAKPLPVSDIEHSLALAFKRKLPQPLLLGHERVKLRWMKPGPNGLEPST